MSEEGPRPREVLSSAGLRKKWPKRKWPPKETKIRQKGVRVKESA